MQAGRQGIISYPADGYHREGVKKMFMRGYMFLFLKVYCIYLNDCNRDNIGNKQSRAIAETHFTLLESIMHMSNDKRKLDAINDLTIMSSRLKYISDMMVGEDGYSILKSMLRHYKLDHKTDEFYSKRYQAKYNNK